MFRQSQIRGVTEARKDRRPIGLRQNTWVRATAAWLTRAGIRPNHISILSVVFAALSAACFVLAATADAGWRSVWFLAAAGFIPPRGLCNLCDGLMAIEGGLKTKSGELFNDLPDRISDSLVLVAAGHSITWGGWGPELGWAAGLLAVLTAYVRVLGGCAGASQQFCGPMAKTHRMVVIGAACVAAAVESALGWTDRAMTVALAVVAVGSVVTITRRTVRIAKQLESA